MSNIIKITEAKREHIECCNCGEDMTRQVEAHCLPETNWTDVAKRPGLVKKEVYCDCCAMDMIRKELNAPLITLLRRVSNNAIKLKKKSVTIHKGIRSDTLNTNFIFNIELELDLEKSQIHRTMGYCIVSRHHEDVWLFRGFKEFSSVYSGLMETCVENMYLRLINLVFDDIATVDYTEFYDGTEDGLADFFIFDGNSEGVDEEEVVEIT